MGCQTRLFKLAVELVQVFSQLLISLSAGGCSQFRLCYCSDALAYCSVNFIDNFNLLMGHRQLFKLDGLHPNRLGARVLKENIYFSFRHPTVVCANPLGLNGTYTPRQKTTGLQISLRVIMWLTHPLRSLITPRSQNNHCSWTSRLSPAHRAHQIQTVTYYNISKTQYPRTTFWKTVRKAWTTFYSHRKHKSQSPSQMQTHYPSLQHLHF